MGLPAADLFSNSCSALKEAYGDSNQKKKAH
jgi:hypothetical protein